MDVTHLYLDFFFSFARVIFVFLQSTPRDEKAFEAHQGKLEEEREAKEEVGRIAKEKREKEKRQDELLVLD